MLSSLFLSAALAATSATASSCCWGDYWADSYWLALKWDETTSTAKCGLSGSFPDGTKCTIETSKTSEGYQQALANVTFGVDDTPFRFRIGINADDCSTLDSDKVVTGWENWGAYLFTGHEFNSQDMTFCDGAGAV